MSTVSVPSKLTLRDVIRPAKGETPAARLHRLAQKAVIEGCRVIRMHGNDALFAVTSASADATAYLVDVRAGRCGCEGFGCHGVCKHLAIALAELGELPDPEPPRPAAPAYRCDACQDTGRMLKPSTWFAGKMIEGFCPHCTPHYDFTRRRFVKPAA